MRHSFCAASFRNTSPRCRRSSPYSVFLRHFGMKTTWYLHSHFVWLRLSSSSIDEVSFRVLGGSRSEASSMDPLKCQTSTANPAEPGGLSLTLERPRHDLFVVSTIAFDNPSHFLFSARRVLRAGCESGILIFSGSVKVFIRGFCVSERRRLPWSLTS